MPAPPPAPVHKVGAEPAGALLLVHSVSRCGIDGRGALVRPHVVRHELEEALGVEVGGNRRDLVPILWGGGAWGFRVISGPGVGREFVSGAMSGARPRPFL